ncbi:hypothetical protein LEP1GSC021_4600 [Leptospira noguchii str. 1993005606]|nr:hypothetical protein LEP1GSC021_4600 [Leptospira noguchii str. 1993005606]
MWELSQSLDLKVEFENVGTLTKLDLKASSAKKSEGTRFFS